MKQNQNTILTNGRIMDPSQKLDKTGDLYLQNGVIVKEGSFDRNEAEIVDMKGCVVAPGFIDVHVHLRQPGKTAAETIRTGTQAAAAGGITTVVAMPNTTPCADNPGTIQDVKDHARKEAFVKVLPCGAMTIGLEGKDMTGIGGLKQAGVVALSDDGRCVQNHELMRHIVEYAKNFRLPIMDHCEETTLAAEGVMHEGYWSVLLGMKGISSASEELIIARNILLARMADWKIHMQHVSSKYSVDLLRHARKQGIRVTGEATPHHLTLTDAEIKRFDTNYKMNPPLRSEEDRQALIEGVLDGTITIIATDHAPHTATAKMVEFDYAPFGIIGLETSFALCCTELHHKHKLSLNDLISKYTVGPADMLGLPLGTLREGAPADITVLDPDCEYTIDANRFYSKARNTPFHGFEVKGRVMATFVDGKCVYDYLHRPEQPF